MVLGENVRAVADLYGVATTSIQRAAAESVHYREKFRDALSRDFPVPGQVDLVLLGSFARNEVTQDSDCDYLILVHGAPDLDELRRLRRIFSSIVSEYEFRAPGGTGTFGDFATTTELVGRIGLEGDSNANTTRRLLLLMESVSVLNPPVRAEFINQMLARYCSDYLPERRSVYDRITAPRFLLNDVIRYWRTLAVDFGAKKWRSLSDDWFVRYAKLLTTRKVLFAGSLAALLTVPVALAPIYDGDEPDQAHVHDRLVDHLRTSFELPPLDRLMALHPHLGDDSRPSLGLLLAAYESMIALLSERGIRDRLNDETKTDLRQQVEMIANQIEECLEQIFFQDELLAPSTRRLCLF